MRIHAAETHVRPIAHNPRMEPQIRYARTSDGVSIAYTVTGEGTPVVFASNALGDIHWYTHNADTRAQVDMLVAAGCRVIRYDMRGKGSSDRDVADLSLAARILDLETVVDHLKLDRFALCGYVHGAATSIGYAVQHKERVSQLVLVNAFVSGAAYLEKIPAARATFELLAMAERDWEFYTLTFASALGGHGDPARALATAALIRGAVSPAVWVRFHEESRKVDLRGMLADVEAPTLVVMDPSGIGNVELGKAVAAGIAGARLVTSDDYICDLLVFLGHDAPVRDVAPPKRGAEPTSGTAVILFTDIVSSTALTEQLGDARFRDASRALDAGLRAAIRDAGGEAIEGKLLGDGVLATFPSAAQAIDGARRCLALSAASELGLHIGLHAGDVIREDNNVYGGSVNIASRICGLCASGEILVSDVVRGMARSSAGVEFEDRGEQEMKGVGEPVRVYAVRWRE
jgi:class 3 adenylate cyclase/alpha-beta hydrolase superfamily lysophospholipase